MMNDSLPLFVNMIVTRSADRFVPGCLQNLVLRPARPCRLWERRISLTFTHTSAGLASGWHDEQPLEATSTP